MADLNIQKLGNNNSNSKEIKFTTLGHKGLRDILRSHIMPQVGIEFRAVEKATHAVWQSHSKRKIILRLNHLNLEDFLIAFAKKAPSVPNLHLDISQISAEHQIEIMEYLLLNPDFFNTIKSISFPPRWFYTLLVQSESMLILQKKSMPIEFFQNIEEISIDLFPERYTKISHKQFSNLLEKTTQLKKLQCCFKNIDYETLSPEAQMRLNSLDHLSILDPSIHDHFYPDNTLSELQANLFTHPTSQLNMFACYTQESIVELCNRIEQGVEFSTIESLYLRYRLELSSEQISTILEGMPNLKSIFLPECDFKYKQFSSIAVKTLSKVENITFHNIQNMASLSDFLEQTGGLKSLEIMDYSDPNIKSLSEPARNILSGLETFKCNFEYDELEITLPLLPNLQALKFYWDPHNNQENILRKLRNLENLTELNLLRFSDYEEGPQPFNTNNLSDILSACNHLTRFTFAICKNDVKWSKLSEAALKTLAQIKELDMEKMEASTIRRDILFILKHAKNLNKIVLPDAPYKIKGLDLSGLCFYEKDFERLKKLLAAKEDL